VRREHFGHEDLEFLEITIADVAAALLRERLLQRPALIHRGRGNDAARIRDRLHASQLARCEFHAAILYRGM